MSRGLKPAQRCLQLRHEYDMLWKVSIQINEPDALFPEARIQMFELVKKVISICGLCHLENEASALGHFWLLCRIPHLVTRIFLAFFYVWTSKKKLGFKILSIIMVEPLELIPWESSTDWISARTQLTAHSACVWACSMRMRPPGIGLKHVKICGTWVIPGSIEILHMLCVHVTFQKHAVLFELLRAL